MQTHEDLHSPSKRATTTLIVGALLPLGLSVFFHASGPMAQQVAKGEDRPALVFEQYMVNLRDRVWPGERFIGAKFRFNNSGSRSAKITELVPSCGCLNPRVEKFVYEPGEKGELYIRVETPNEEPGPKEYFVQVRYEDPKPREVELRFKVILPKPQVVVRPRALIFSYRNSTEETTKDVVITDYRPKTFRITGIQSTSKLVTAELAEAGADEMGNPQQHVTITISGNVPAGVHRGRVLVTTDDAQYSEVVIPIRVQATSAKATADKVESQPRRRHR